MTITLSSFLWHLAQRPKLFQSAFDDTGICDDRPWRNCIILKIWIANFYKIFIRASFENMWFSKLFVVKRRVKCVFFNVSTKLTIDNISENNSKSLDIDVYGNFAPNIFLYGSNTSQIQLFSPQFSADSKSWWI